jgi:hypothetical protein
VFTLLGRDKFSLLSNHKVNNLPVVQPKPYPFIPSTTYKYLQSKFASAISYASSREIVPRKFMETKNYSKRDLENLSHSFFFKASMIPVHNLGIHPSWTLPLVNIYKEYKAVGHIISFLADCFFSVENSSWP